MMLVFEETSFVRRKPGNKGKIKLLGKRFRHARPASLFHSVSVGCGDNCEQ